MTFVYPAFLWALLAVAVPVVIHLFNFRRYKKVYFSNVKYLKEIQLESKSRNRLRELLILAARCLALACLVMAFCQPVLNADDRADGAGTKTVGIYIDNSFSMENVGRQGPLLGLAQKKARELIGALEGNVKFQILTNSFEARHQRFYAREAALQQVDEIKVSPAVKNLSEVLKRQVEFLNTATGRKSIFILSDAQKSTFDINTLSPDTNIRAHIIHLKSNKVNNILLDTCWFEAPVQQKGVVQKLHARVVNMGDAEVSSGSAKLFINDRQAALSSFTLGAGASQEMVFTFECKDSRFDYGYLKIEDYPVTFDDQLYIAYNSMIDVPVCLVNGKDKTGTDYFGSLFKGDSLFILKEFREQSIDFRAFKESKVLVLNQLSEFSSGLQSEVEKFCRLGGALLIVPPVNANKESYNTLLNSLSLPLIGEMDTVAVPVQRIETGTGLFAGVFEKLDDRINLPMVNKHYHLARSNRNDFDALLTLRNGEVLLGTKQYQGAAVYLFSASPDEGSSNFGRHAVFVPTVYRIAFTSFKPLPLFYHVAQNSRIQVPLELKTDDPPHLKGLSDSTDIIPETRVIGNAPFIFTRGQISNAGFYELGDKGRRILPLAFNYERRESRLDAYDDDELAKIISNRNLKSFRLTGDTGEKISSRILEGEEGKKLWKFFLILSLLFIVTEIVLLRVFK
jgi:hypothetical protein